MNFWIIALAIWVNLCLSQSQVQVHVSLGAIPGQVNFVWSTRQETPTSMVRITIDSSIIYFQGNASAFVDGNNIWSIHTVTASLTPGNSYIYQVGCSSTGFSSNFNLLVPVDSEPSNFFIYGDLSTEVEGRQSWKDIEQLVKIHNAQAIVQLGDMAYDLYTDSSKWGDLFMETLEPVASYIPYQVCAGNHESGDGYKNYLARFAMPGSKFYFTYTIGYVRFLAIHTEAFLSETDKLPDMMAYIQSVLNRSPSDRAKYPWMIVYGHRPMYCSSPDSTKTCGKQAASILAYMEGIMNEYEVDIYVSGHVHNYQRTTPIYQGNIVGPNSQNTYINPTAPIYVVSGGAGGSAPNDPVSLKNTPEWLKAVEQEYSFSLLTVNSTHLSWQQFLSSTETVFDTFTVIKNLKQIH